VASSEKEDEDRNNAEIDEQARKLRTSLLPILCLTRGKHPIMEHFIMEVSPANE